jgi:hypothetical protein
MAAGIIPSSLHPYYHIHTHTHASALTHIQLPELQQSVEAIVTCLGAAMVSTN